MYGTCTLYEHKDKRKRRWFQSMESHGIGGEQEEDVQWTKIKENRCMFLFVNVYIYIYFYNLILI